MTAFFLRRWAPTRCLPALVALALAAGCAAGGTLDGAVDDPTADSGGVDASLAPDGAAADSQADAAAEAHPDAAAEAPREAGSEASLDAARADASDGSTAYPDAPDAPVEAAPPDAPPDSFDAPADVVTDTLLCPHGTKACGGQCVSTTDPAHGCGAGDCTACALDHATTTCNSGVCGVQNCASGFGDCDGVASNGCEADLSSDPAHCRQCSSACPSTTGTPSCIGGTCGVSSCTTGLGDCDQDPLHVCETNLDSSPTNCGYCGHTCTLAGAQAQCTAGVCKIAACVPPYQNCDTLDANGCETNTVSDVNACGGCGIVCAAANGTPSCTGGQCTVACFPGWANCNGLASDGCEAPLNTAVNCGACGVACNPANGAGDCSGGSCALSSCNSGYQSCDGTGTNGCESGTSSDPRNCGSCGVVCNGVHGTPGCNGACTIACDAGYGDCNASTNDGCETVIQGDPAHCGGCASVCTAPANATATCTGSTCGFSCAVGYGDCDGLAGNGCETNLNTDSGHCGACATVCTIAQACGGGVCGGVSCSAPLADCDGVAGNGCETNLNTSASHCGTCSTVCPAGTPCTSGVCIPTTCSTGTGDCDGLAANGCETNLTNDLAHCGTCATVCAAAANATRTCTGGACGIACNAGFGNCNASAADGCEATFATDAAHCGSCAVACTAGQTCLGGACQAASCGAGTANCDGSSANGCECAGTACCGAGCQTTHSNGLGQSFYDCAALGTLDQTQATEAANAWPTSGNIITGQAQDSFGFTLVVCKQGTASCACWGYQDIGFHTGAGWAYLSNTSTCYVAGGPGAGNVQWN